MELSEACDEQRYSGELFACDEDMDEKESLPMAYAKAVNTREIATSSLKAGKKLTLDDLLLAQSSTSGAWTDNRLV